MRVLLDYKEELKAKEIFNSRAIGGMESAKKPLDFSSPNMDNKSNTDPVYPTILDELQSQKVIDLPL